MNIADKVEKPAVQCQRTLLLAANISESGPSYNICKLQEMQEISIKFLQTKGNKQAIVIFLSFFGWSCSNCTILPRNRTTVLCL